MSDVEHPPETRGFTKTKAITYTVDTRGCHNCNSHSRSKGYPMVMRNGRTMQMSRLIWEKYHGPIPSGLCVLHDCDNAACINPEHLHLGTQKKNVAEAIERGLFSGHQFDAKDRAKIPCGEDCYAAKLTEKQVKEIRRSEWKYGSCAEFARRFRVGETTIRDVRRGKSWRHVE